MCLQGQAPLLDSLPEGCVIRTGFYSAVDQGQGAPQPRAQARGCGDGGEIPAWISPIPNGVCVTALAHPHPAPPKLPPRPSHPLPSRAPMGAHLPLVPPASLLAPQQDLGAFM